ncbi:MAG: response regulator [Opitutaceae bacterium]
MGNMPFPRHPSTSAAAPRGDHEGGSPPSRKILRILYAEDMAELRDVARIALARDGHAVECVEDGAIALQQVTADLKAFDIVITDHHMPKVNGLELVTQLRALNYPGKVMIFSSELSREIHASYQRLNVDRMVFKPVFPSTLRQVLADLFPPDPDDAPIQQPPPASPPAPRSAGSGSADSAS